MLPDTLEIFLRLNTEPNKNPVRTHQHAREMAPLYPSFSANKSGHLQVSDIHSIYWEECGNPNGVPIIYLHGGPGNGIQVNVK